jgi:hypothetical protein
MKIYDSMEMSASEKEIAKSGALEKIRAELSAEAGRPARVTGERMNGKKRSGRGFGRRRFVAAIAAAIVLAFTSVAFAAGWFDLGTVRSAHGSFEAAVLADSPQFQALQEYQDFVDRAAAKGNVGWTSDYEAEDGVYMEENAFQEKISELCEKYGLRMETVTYTPETFGETLAGAGVENFLGSFGGLSADTKNKFAGDYEASTSGYFLYRDLGSFDIGMPLDDGSTGSHHAYWYINGVKTDVFISQPEGWSSAFYGSEPGGEEWEYTTKDGYAVKCSLIRQTTANGLNEVYDFILTAGGYMLDFHMTQPVPEGEQDTFTKAGLEKIIEQFDFSRLDK